MKNPLVDIQRFRSFLSNIPITDYRNTLKDIKYVEQDLPDELLPLKSIYYYYWETRNFLDFDSWFEIFWEEILSSQESRNALHNFKKYYYNRDIDDNGWFKLGFKARMYRTWISILTQLDFCYMFEYLSEKKGLDICLECNADLDKRGIDARVNDICFQIQKITQRKEARSATKKRNLVLIPYAVFNLEELMKKLNNPRVRKKNVYENTLSAFSKYFSYLPNGFVIFSEAYVEEIMNNINDIDKIKSILNRIISEITGDY